MKKVFFLLFYIMLFFLWAEPLAPVPGMLSNFSDIKSNQLWIGVWKYIPALESFEFSGSTQQGTQGNHSWTYGLGVGLPLFSTPNFIFKLDANMFYQSALSPYGFWYFHSSAFFSDLIPSLNINTDFGILTTFVKQSCKHDLDQSRRLIIHQPLGIGYKSQILQNPWSAIWIPEAQFTITVERNIPISLPDKPVEKYVWSGSSEILLNIFSFTSDSSISTRFRTVLIGNEGNIFNLDYQWTLLYRHKMPAYFLSLFVEIHKMNDPWVDYNNVPVQVFSFGLLLQT